MYEARQGTDYYLWISDHNVHTSISMSILTSLDNVVYHLHSDVTMPNLK
jgi:hypothetical protein